MTFGFAVVTWLDAHTVDGWHEDLDTEPRECTTSGYIVKETDKAICIANSIDPKPPITYACVMTIPKVCVLKVRKFK
jgi:hypothetical protein